MSPKKFVLTRLALRVAMSRLVSRDGGATILPIILNDTRVPPLLWQSQWIDLRGGDFEKGVGQPINELRSWWGL
jgi:hypothetical protein